MQCRNGSRAPQGARVQAQRERVVAADAKRQHLSVAASDAANWQVRPAAGTATPPVCGGLGKARWVRAGVAPSRTTRHCTHAAHCADAW